MVHYHCFSDKHILCKNYIYHYNSPLGSITLASDGKSLTGLWLDGQKYFPYKLISESIETELSILPQWQRDRAESLIDKVVLTDSSASGSGYDYRSRTLYVHPDHSAGDMIHEYGHALEISLDLRHNQKYIQVRRSGLDLSDLSKVVLDSGTYTEYVQYLTCDKFISTYQGRLYESPDYGIFKKDSSEIDEAMLKEYFSEGFRAFYKEPALLKEKDPKPYEFIEGLSDDQK